MQERDFGDQLKTRKPVNKIAGLSALLLAGALIVSADQPIAANKPIEDKKQPPPTPLVLAPTPEPPSLVPTMTLPVPTSTATVETVTIIQETAEIPGTPEELKNYIGYRVVGSKVYNPSGEEILFRGASRPSLEWGHGDNMGTPEDAGYSTMKEWGFNTVRLPLSQVFWLSDPSYQQKVEEQVKWANDQGLNVILDLHRSGKGDLTESAQQQMPDNHSIDFWKQVAGKYKDNPAVLFELYNEPRDVSGDVYMYGGMTGDGFETPGMQTLIDVIRDEGALNIVILNGLNWGFDHRGIPPAKGVNIMKGGHPYGEHNGKNTVADFDAAFGYLIDQGEAVIVTEFGHSFECESTFYETVSEYAQDRGMHWVAWALWADKNAAEPDKSCGFPGFVEDWDFKPLPTGRDIEQSLQTPFPDGSVLDQ
jgi:endoglucanase